MGKSSKVRLKMALNMQVFSVFNEQTGKFCLIYLLTTTITTSSRLVTNYYANGRVYSGMLKALVGLVCLSNILNVRGPTTDYVQCSTIRILPFADFKERVFNVSFQLTCHKRIKSSPKV